MGKLDTSNSSAFPSGINVSTKLEAAFTLSSKEYTSDEVFQAEQTMLFNRSWLWLGLSSELKSSGDYLSAKIGRDPIIVVKEGDKLYGFYNVCKHRGGPLVKNKKRCGSLKYNAFICQYHGWTYRLNGQLRGVPAFDRAKLFDKEDFGLMPIEVKVQNGCIFVRKEENHLQENLQNFIGGIKKRMDGLDLSGFHFHQRVSYPIQCNWKVYVDNYLEGYHIPIVHPELAKLIDYKKYRTELLGWYSLQHAPFRPGGNVYQDEGGEAWYWYIFPNLMLNILPNRMQVNVIEPVNASSCIVHFDYYYTNLKEALESGLVKDDLAYSEEIQQEDIEICEEVQKGLLSPAYDRGRFSPDREEGVWHFQELYKGVMQK